MAVFPSWITVLSVIEWVALIVGHDQESLRVKSMCKSCNVYLSLEEEHRVRCLDDAGGHKTLSRLSHLLSTAWPTCTAGHMLIVDTSCSAIILESVCMPGCNLTYAKMCRNPQEVFGVATVVWVLMSG